MLATVLAALVTTLARSVLAALLLLSLAGLVLSAALLLVALRIILLLLIVLRIVLALVVRHGMFSYDLGSLVTKHPPSAEDSLRTRHQFLHWMIGF